MSAPSVSGEPEIESVSHPDTGEEMYMIIGSYPKYFHNLLFGTKEVAEEAKSEAEWVLENEERPENSKFFSAYLEKDNLSDHVVVRE